MSKSGNVCAEHTGCNELLTLEYPVISGKTRNFYVQLGSICGSEKEKSSKTILTKTAKVQTISHSSVLSESLQAIHI